MTLWIHVVAATILATFVVTGTVNGQTKKSYLKYLIKDDPDILGIEVTVDDECPSMESSLEELVEGELLRARIRKGSWIDTMDEVKLHVNMHCTSGKSGSIHQGYIVEVDFAIWRDVDDAAINEYGFYLMRYGTGYGGFGFAPKHLVNKESENLARTQVSKALTDYLRANFGQ